MKALISGIKRMEIHDGDGLRTTVFLKGCSLKCIWCHNPEGIGFAKQVAHFEQKCVGCGSCAAVCPEKAISMVSGKPVMDREKCVGCFSCVAACPTEAMHGYGDEWHIDDLEEFLLQDELFWQHSGGGVTFSGGECMMQPKFVTELSKRLHARGISVDIDTCGQVRREVLEGIMPYVDTFLYDVKAVDPDVHKMCTGYTNEQIISNLRFLSESGCRIEVRYPLVKGYNDMECHKIGQLLKDLRGIVKIKVLKYHHFAGSRYEALGMVNTLPDTETTTEDVLNAVEILKGYGLNAAND